MSKIQLDADFKTALSRLSIDQQRKIGALFIESVMDLSTSPGVKQALATASDAEFKAGDIEESYRKAKAAAIESYTLCGHEGNWAAQANHFVATAAAACLAPADQCHALAWGVAMNARIARVCQGIAEGQGSTDTEAGKQYAILEQLLSTA